MCLAIAMYLVTGILTIVFQILFALGIFILTLLGKIILFVCAMIYGVARPGIWLRRNDETNVLSSSSSQNINETTMYPEFDFEDDYDDMAKQSLETIPSIDNNSVNIESSVDDDDDRDKELSPIENELNTRETLRMICRSIEVLFPETENG